jgi:hypothetical protein
MGRKSTLTGHRKGTLQTRPRLFGQSHKRHSWKLTFPLPLPAVLPHTTPEPVETPDSTAEYRHLGLKEALRSSTWEFHVLRNFADFL